MEPWVVGQERALGQLQMALAQGKLSHAYLLVGPPQVGKMTLALALAQALNCPEASPPCGTCSSCRRIASGLHPDVQVIALGGGGGPPRAEIGIAQIHELQRAAALMPFEGRYRVFIIDGAEHLSAEAANCLLKTLEEPPPQVLLALLAVDEALPATLLSRCQRIRLNPLPLSALQEALEVRWGASPETAGLLARLSRGRLGWAVAALERPQVLQVYREARDRLAALTWASRGQRLALAEAWAGRFGRDRRGVLELIQVWQGWWRDLMLIQGGGSQLIANVDAKGELSAQTSALSLGQILAFIRALARAEDEVRLNTNLQLALEVLMLDLPRSDISEPRKGGP